MTDVVITAGSFRLAARFETTAAPRTCEAFRKLLPFSNRLVHVRWSGEALWVPLGDLALPVPVENATCYPAPGQILFYPGGISETEILIPYGATSFASKAGPLAGNHFLTVVSGGEHLTGLGRAALCYGTLGSNVPALMRAVVACGWFGIQAWIGGEALNTFFKTTIPEWPGLLGSGFGGHATTEWLSFLIFWGLNIYIIYRGMDLLRAVENWAAPFVLVMTAALLWWAISNAHGLGPLLSQPGKFRSFAEFAPVFIPSLTAMIGYWATLSLNMPDFTRFGRSQREQALGQVVALPATMSLFAAMGVLITSASAIIYGQPIWDPVQLVGRFSSAAVVAMAMFTIVVATIAVNIAANVVSPANDFANAFPRMISFKTGGLITGLLGIVIQPWKLLADPSGYIYTWLLGYSGGLGSIAGVLIADYWIVRRRELNLEDLYRVDGVYSGWNWRAIGATAFGCALAWSGLVVPMLRPLYDYAWFVGLLTPGAAHVLFAYQQTRPKAAMTLGSA